MPFFATSLVWPCSALMLMTLTIFVAMASLLWSNQFIRPLRPWTESLDSWLCTAWRRIFMPQLKLLPLYLVSTCLHSGLSELLILRAESQLSGRTLRRFWNVPGKVTTGIQRIAQGNSKHNFFFNIYWSMSLCRFYRCVKFNQYENDYTIFEYGCPTGLVFDDRWEVCVWPSQAAPCDGSSEIRPVPKQEYSCPTEGYFVDPENCRWFFACLDHKGDGQLTHYEFRCPFGLAFDEELLICNWPWLVPACGGARGTGAQRRPLPSLRRQKSFGGRGGIPVHGGRRPNNLRGVIAKRPELAGSPGNFKSKSPARRPIASNGGRRQRLRVTPAPGYVQSTTPYANPTTPYATTRRPAYPSTTARPVYPSTTRRPAYQDNVYGEIVSDSCENCESPTLTIRGNGRLTGAGIEVGLNRPSYPQAPRKPKQQYNPSTTPSYQTPSTTAGYNYPVPENPLEYPERNPSNGIGISNIGEYGLRPANDYNNVPSSTYAPTTPNTPAYGVSTTYAPTTPRPTYPSSTRAPTYHTSAAPAYNSPAPAYQFTKTASPAYPSTTRAPAYPSTTARPAYPSTTARPAYPSTTARPAYPSTTATPAYPSTTARPAYPSTTARPAYPSSTRAPAYQPTYESEYEPSYQEPAYQQPSYQPTYQSTTARPYPSTTRRPTYPSTTRRPTYPSTTRRPSYPSSTRAPAYPSTTARPAYQSSTRAPSYPSAVPAYQPTYDESEYEPEYEQPSYQPAYQPSYHSSPRPASYPTTRRPYPSVTSAKPYPVSTTRRPSYPSTTARPVSYPSSTRAPTFYQEGGAGYQADANGYSYPVPSNPLVLPERKPKQQSYGTPAPSYPDKSKFKAPEIEYGGFVPHPKQPDEPRAPKQYQQPTYGSPQPAQIEYGFKPSYNEPTTRPTAPKQPYYGQGSGKAPTSTSPQYRPDYSDQEEPSYVSTVASAIYDYVSTTVAPYIPSFTAPKPAPKPSSGYKYPVPSNPLQYPNRQGKNLRGQQEVASVIPNGFTSATLSNGPNSIPHDEDRFKGGFVSGRPNGGHPIPAHGVFSNGPAQRPSTGFGSGRPSHSFSAHKPSGPFSAPRPHSGGSRPNVKSPPRPSNGAFHAQKPQPNPRPDGHINDNGPRAFGGHLGPNESKGNGGFNGPNGPRGNGGFNGPRGNGGFNGARGNGGFNGPNGPRGNGGFNGPRGNGGFNGPRGNGGFNGPRGNGGFNGQAPRGGRNQNHGNRFAGGARTPAGLNGVTTVSRPAKQPALLTKFAGNDWNKFGPGGYRTFNDTLGPEVCERPGLFRHPTECGKFYECYWDKWVEKYTLHVFPCPVVLGYDSGITACNWPFDGPQCQA